MTRTKFPYRLLDIQDKFQPNPVRNKRLVKHQIHKESRVFAAQLKDFVGKSSFILVEDKLTS